jgi:hypothetical protein
MATYNKYQEGSKTLMDFGINGQTFKVMLSNTAPNASTHAVRADVTEIAGGGGYTSGGNTTAVTTSTSAGVAKATAADVTFTATTGFGPFRYAILYNDTPTSPVDPLIAWWDYGSAITLAASETLTVDFDASTGVFTIT